MKLKVLVILSVFLTILFLSSCNDKPEINSSDILSNSTDTQTASTTTTQETSIVQTTADKEITSITATENITTTIDELNKYKDLLSQVDYYQEQYFEICKIIEKNGTPEEFAQRDELFVEVESKVTQDNEYYNRYIRIEPDLEENRYGYEDVPYDYFYNPVTVYTQQYEKYDELLNDLYSYVKLQIPNEAFESLKDSEIQWIKDKEAFLKSLPVDENDRYALAYKAEMTKYRCLLLMLSY